VESATTALRNDRRRLAFFPASKCRLPARERNTLPPAVILNRLATAFRVFGALALRINRSQPKRARTIPPKTQEASGNFRFSGVLFDLSSHLQGPDVSGWLGGAMARRDSTAASRWFCESIRSGGASKGWLCLLAALSAILAAIVFVYWQYYRTPGGRFRDDRISFEGIAYWELKNGVVELVLPGETNLVYGSYRYTNGNWVMFWRHGDTCHLRPSLLELQVLDDRGPSYDQRLKRLFCKPRALTASRGVSPHY
jgi:hypothetical protein